MVETVERIGRFTSSQIWKLTTLAKNGIDFGAPALTYIEEKRAERSLGRSVDLGKGNQSTVWGNVMEYYCDKFHLGLEYKMASKQTDVNPKYPFHSGTKDFTREEVAGDIKCFEPKKFYELTMSLIKLNEELITLEEFKKEEKEVYWQVVSNCVILGKPKGEIISYCPTENQLMEIRAEIEDTNVLEKLGIDPWRARFIFEEPIHKLPYVKNPNFPNFTNYVFDIPTEDIIFLTKCIRNAEKLLTNE